MEGAFVLFTNCLVRDYFSPTEQTWFPGHWTRKVYWRARTEAVCPSDTPPSQNKRPGATAESPLAKPCSTPDTRLLLMWEVPGITSLAVHGSTLEDVTTFIFQRSCWKMTAPKAVTRASPVPQARARASHLSTFPISRSFSQAGPGLTDYSQMATNTREANPF